MFNKDETKSKKWQISFGLIGIFLLAIVASGCGNEITTENQKETSSITKTETQISEEQEQIQSQETSSAQQEEKKESAEKPPITENQPQEQVKEQSKQEQSQPKPKPIWHTVTTFSGSSNKTTSPFSITGDQWRAKWNFQETDTFGGVGKGVFGASIYRVGESSSTESIYHSRSSANDITYIYEGKGDFYIRVTVANTKGWSITIEDLY